MVCAFLRACLKEIKYHWYAAKHVTYSGLYKTKTTNLPNVLIGIMMEDQSTIYYFIVMLEASHGESDYKL